MFGTGPSATANLREAEGAPPPPRRGARAVPRAPSGPYGGGQGAPHGVPPGPPMRGPPRVRSALIPAAVTEYVMCPPEKAGKVIGHGGDKINSIQAESGASVKIQNQSDVGPGQPRRITITGSPDRVARASQLVYALIQAAAAEAARVACWAARSEIFVPVDPEHFGKIIGRGGDTIRRLQEESGVRMRWIARIVAYKSRATPRGAREARTRPARGARRVSGRRGDVWTDDDGDSGARSRGRIIGNGRRKHSRVIDANRGEDYNHQRDGHERACRRDADKVEAAVAVVEDFIDKQINPVRVTNAGMHRG